MSRIKQLIEDTISQIATTTGQDYNTVFDLFMVHSVSLKHLPELLKVINKEMSLDALNGVLFVYDYKSVNKGN